MNNYCIKEGYKSRKSSLTLDEKRETPFWDKRRLISNGAYQYHVYKYAKAIIERFDLNNYVVDVGCGSAVKLNKVIGRKTDRFIGIDQESVVRFCKKTYKKGEYLSDNFEKPQLTINKTIDLVICSDVIEHVYDPDILIDYIKHLSLPDTYIVISTPERDLLRGEECMESKKPEHVREWNKKELRCYLESSGFTILEHQLLYPLKFSFRLFREYFSILYRQLSTNRSFKYNQVVLCKVAKQ
jgi:SAM-dependent methyltransferase